MSEEIEFNNGFVTALALFYGHMMRESTNTDMDYRIYGASDHLYNLEFPREIDFKAPELKIKIQLFVQDVFKARNDDRTKEAADKLFERCKELLMEIDRQLFNMSVTSNYD